MSSSGGGKGRGGNRQGIGEAFLVSLVRQIARSIGQVIARSIFGRGGR